MVKVDVGQTLLFILALVGQVKRGVGRTSRICFFKLQSFFIYLAVHLVYVVYKISFGDKLEIQEGIHHPIQITFGDSSLACIIIV